MRNKLIALAFTCATAGVLPAAMAATAEITLDWSQAGLSMAFGSGSLLNINDGVSIDTQIYTDHGIWFDGGYQTLDTVYGINKASGQSGAAKALMLENGSSQVNVSNGGAAIIDLQANAQGVFRVPYAYLLSTTGAGDVGASVSYTFETVNYQLDGPGSVPTQTFSGSFIAGSSESKSGQGYIEILLSNTTDQLLRFQLVQGTTALASSSAVAAVPEPSTYMMMLLGLAGVFASKCYSRRRQ
jgi:hypothetical protein